MKELIKDKLKSFPPVYYISLEESIDRRQNIETQFKKYGINNYTSLISKRFHETSDIIHGKYVWSLNNTNKGSSTSLLKVIKKWITEADEPYAVFFEDDVSFDTVEYWNFTWEEFFQRIPDDWECVQMLWVRNDPKIEDIKFQERLWDYWAVTAFLLKRESGKKLIEKFMSADDSNIFTYELDDVQPLVENIIYGYNKTYSFPLFVEQTNFASTSLNSPDVNPSSCMPDETPVFTEGQCRGHHETRNLVLNWWKTIGSNILVDNL